MESENRKKTNKKFKIFKKIKVNDANCKMDNVKHNSGLILYSSPVKNYQHQTIRLQNKKRFQRAGIIPYIIENGIKYYCMGIDTKFKNLTDFGGGCGKSEYFLQAAIRELNEESLGIFNISDFDEVKRSSSCTYDDTVIVVFYELKDIDKNKIILEFNKRLNDINSPEISKILWIQEEILKQIIDMKEDSIKIDDVEYPRVYSRIKNLIKPLWLVAS